MHVNVETQMSYTVS